MNWVLVCIFAYVAVQLLVGVLVSRKVRTEDDYLVAGRRLGFPLVACSVFATWFGAETCIGASGEIYSDGLGRTSVEPFAYGLCLVLAGLLFVSPFWKLRITTLSDFLRTRYSSSVERLSAILLIPTSLLWAAAQIRAFGQILASASSFDVETAILAAAGIAIVYTVFGGLLADVITDFVQGGILVAGLAVLVGCVVWSLGGEAISAIDGEKIRFVGEGLPGFWSTVEAWAIPVCGSLTAQEVISRSLAARSAGVARRATVTGGAIYLLVGLMPVYLALVAGRFFLEVDDAEQVLPALAADRMPVFLYVLFSGALVSAILSTVDSALLVSSSLLSRNLLLSFGAEVGERRRVLLARAGVVGFGFAACFFALQAEGVFALVEEASGFGSAGVLIVVGLGLFTRIGGKWAALLCLLAGIGAWVWGAHLSGRFGGEPMSYPYLFSLFCAAVGFLAGWGFDRCRGPLIRGRSRE